MAQAIVGFTLLKEFFLVTYVSSNVADLVTRRASVSKYEEFAVTRVSPENWSSCISLCGFLHADYEMKVVQRALCPALRTLW